ncbi:hypothetical protein GCM10009601_44330 [Streptomyces thermospinosisporus]|uniref:Uncharacterized protein n=1 Tax=Streptomyces thermospinosisporus TaxID=161482 RepID=A0ABP4JTR5_9ACTN
MTYELISICDACKQAIADGEGGLWVDMSEVEQASINERAWEQLEAEQHESGVRTFSGESIQSYPDPARWRVHHYSCDPSPSANSYAIEVHRCRSWADLVWWTAHLMGKSWLGQTDWDELLQQASESAGNRITPAVRPHLHQAQWAGRGSAQKTGRSTGRPAWHIRRCHLD